MEYCRVDTVVIPEPPIPSTCNLENDIVFTTLNCDEYQINVQPEIDSLHFRYKWYLNNELISFKASNALDLINGFNTITLQVNKNDTCYIRIDTSVISEECDTLYFINIPNVITPNNDGFNDIFEIDFNYSSIDLEIYNRWGKKIYQRENYQNDWETDDLNDGVYYYKVLIPEINKSVKGWVQILR